jgi:hypothetical protein
MKTLLVALSVSVLGITAVAAQTPASQGGEWLNIGALNSKLEAQGYNVLEVERDDGRYEVELTDANGDRYEAKVDRTSGKIIKRERDDD